MKFAPLKTVLSLAAAGLLALTAAGCGASDSAPQKPACTAENVAPGSCLHPNRPPIAADVEAGLACYNAVTGAPLWRSELKKQYDPAKRVCTPIK